jgi:hypothetical protein
MVSRLPVNQWKEIAWCGVRFKTPVDWHLSQIGIRYLALEDEFGPAMEIKWAPVKGKFSKKALLKRLVSLQKKQVRKAIKPKPVSSEWESVLTEFETGEFSWQTDAIHGRGLLLFCPTCRNATLIQFFRKQSGNDDSVATRVLKTFRDHRADGQVLWAAYDIRALVPQTFKLKRYRFEAGQYELDFVNGSDRIVLHRWAPATVLLRKLGLAQFAKTVADFGKTEPVPGSIAGCETVEWSVSPITGWQRWLSRFKRKSSYYWLGLWHLETKNRILGIRAEGKNPLDTELLDRIFTHYESI